ncbi:hypothetical protein FRX31_029659 [Thalictrum thalictroides]|uniref:Uncharacterized protein n=1 Tax=Thalictrum thalictroides TaxID=46969 RepID=A0A7J6V6K9_THATH|nr:hypothetical protein FRX31_029659 [Thalictrum thalictroides]
MFRLAYAIENVKGKVLALMKDERSITQVCMEMRKRTGFVMDWPKVMAEFVHGLLGLFVQQFLMDI